MRKNLTIFVVTAATVASLTVAIAQDKGAVPLPGAPQAKGRGFGRGGKKGPAGPLPRLSDGKPDITGVWNGFGGSGQDAPDMLPWAAKVVADHRAAGGAEDFEARCLPGGPPRAAPYHTSFFATPKLVVMLFEGNIHTYRQIFIDGREHPKDLDPTWYGHSIGKWDGDTLVVDTVGFNDKFWFDFAGHPHTEQLHVIERFRRRDLGNLDMDITIEDPAAYTEPWKLKRTSVLMKGEISEYICNENNQDVEHLVGK